MFDDLQQALQQTSYIPSFGKPNSARSKKNQFQPKKIETKIQDTQKSIKVEEKKSPFFSFDSEEKKGPISFQEILKQEKLNNDKKLQRNGSSYQFISNKKNEELQAIPIQRRMKPPLSKKGEDLSNKSQTFSQKRKDHDFPQPKIQKKTQINDLNPIGMLAQQQKLQSKKHTTQQLELFQKMTEKLIETQRQARKKQIQKLKQLHAEELKKKLQLKDYQIQKIKEFYQMQLKIKISQQEQHNTLNSYKTKLENNINLIEKLQKKLQSKDKDQNQLFNNKLNRQLLKKQQQIKDKIQQIRIRNQRLQQKQRQIYQTKEKFEKQRNQQMKKLEQYDNRIKKHQQQLQSKFRKKQKQFHQEVQKKKISLRDQMDQFRRERFSLENQKNNFILQKQELNRQIRDFQQRRRSMLDQINIQKSKAMQRELQATSKLNQINSKQNQLDYARSQLINKLKMIELQRKKIQLEKVKTQNKTKYSNLDYNYKKQTKINYESPIQKSIKQMKNQLLKTMPQF